MEGKLAMIRRAKGAEVEDTQAIRAGERSDAVDGDENASAAAAEGGGGGDAVVELEGAAAEPGDFATVKDR